MIAASKVAQSNGLRRPAAQPYPRAFANTVAPPPEIARIGNRGRRAELIDERCVAQSRRLQIGDGEVRRRAVGEMRATLDAGPFRLSRAPAQFRFGRVIAVLCDFSRSAQAPDPKDRYDLY